ncbi:MAG: 3-dehydroquinate synthase [Treponema sp.]|jgi:3-dehydroquinate synthase|nr:3-dehydroquinate synthase [Treponema sp.]
MNLTFTFDGIASTIYIEEAFDDIHAILGGDADGGCARLLVCDENTAGIAAKIAPGIVGNAAGSTAGRTQGVRVIARSCEICVLPAGESAKNWANVEKILKAARDAGLGRDGVFIGVGGGVITDMTAFAASVYMRGAKLALAPTTLLGMVDAAVGGKTGFDLFGIKNFVGTFYPSPLVIMPLESLSTLSGREWKSGFAELLKTAVLDSDDDFLDRIGRLKGAFSSPDFPANILQDSFLRGELLACIARSVEIKGRIVEEDPEETGTRRRLLNLGHTFGHALEASAGLGRLTHGEAVAWGIARACDLGQSLGVTGRDRAEKITGLLFSFGYETWAPHPCMKDAGRFMDALFNDKKKTAGKLAFIVPERRGCGVVFIEKNKRTETERILHIINGEAA